MKVHHLNCVQIESPMGSAIGHCLLIEHNQGLILIDAGIGLNETRAPFQTLGKELIDLTGFQFDEERTAYRQIERLGLDPAQVSDIVISHLDPDHIGGLADFPQARIHLSQEEYQAFVQGNDRYLPYQMAHKPDLALYPTNDSTWLGLSARKIDLPFEIYLIPLFGHTLGHCGVSVKQSEKWLFYAGDAYYLRAELENENHPVDQLATIRAVDNKQRLDALEKVRSLIKNHGNQLFYFGYHDPSEF
ncbi:MBL fold hydrolase [Sediminicola luteus]|uniref:MBL fold hydrolase n=2 Tax=Sediminicola luteus TaxID=319238 RepID=A0A2A4GCR6_9FLAO|nr:MBL fold hydrolase [Sediminicola luteus]